MPWHRNGSGPDPGATGPVRRRPRKVIGRTLGKAWSDSLFGMSSQAAFWCAMSTAPLLLALLGLVGYVANWFGPATIHDVHAQIMLVLHTIFNEEVADNLVGNTVDTILNNGQADAVSVGLIISLWAGSSAMSAFIEAITIAYCQHEMRHPVVERLFALGLYIIALMSGILVLPLLAIWPRLPPSAVPRTLATHRHHDRRLRLLPRHGIGPDPVAGHPVQGCAPNTNTPGHAGCPARSWQQCSSSWQVPACASTCPTSTATD